MKLDAFVKPSFERNGRKIVMSREDGLDEFIPKEMIMSMIEPAEELLEGKQSLEIKMSSSTDAETSLSAEKSLEFELFAASKLEFHLAFHKDLIAKAAETAAKNFEKEDEFEMFKSVIQIVSQALVKLNFEFNFKSANDIPANLQKFMRKNMGDQV